MIRSHSVEGQVSRIDERYLWLSELKLIKDQIIGFLVALFSQENKYRIFKSRKRRIFLSFNDLFSRIEDARIFLKTIIVTSLW